MAPLAFRFGVQARPVRDRQDWIQLAQTAERLGYSVLTLPDHFGSQLAPLSGLMAAADATTTLRLGHLVLANDYRHPVVLAKELATLDLLSEGRLEMAIGAGHDRHDYDMAGIDYSEPGIRIDRLFEALEIVRGLMRPGSFSFDGRHYKITDFDGLPKPIQQLPPLLLGAGGKRMLTYAAQHADIVGINGTMRPGPLPPNVPDSRWPIPHISAASWDSMSGAAVDAKVGHVQDCAAGRQAPPELNIRTFLTHVTDDRDGALDSLGVDLSRDREYLDNCPFVLFGSVAEIVDQLLERRDRWGISYVVVGAAEMESFAPVVAALDATANRVSEDRRRRLPGARSR